MDEEFILALLFAGLCYWIYRKIPKPNKASPIVLSPGNYTAGEDIREGKYNLTATAGIGDFCYRKLNAPDWGFSNPLCFGSALYSDRFRNLDLQKGDILEINCNVTVSATPAAAIADVTKETLHPGIYRFGADVPPGKYTLEVVNGSGYAYVRDPNDTEATTYEFFQFLAKSHLKNAPGFANVKCLAGHELWIMGSLELRLVPVPPKKP